MFHKIIRDESACSRDTLCVCWHIQTSQGSNQYYTPCFWCQKISFVDQNTTRGGKRSLFIMAGCGLPSCWACFDWDRGVRLPHISFSSLRGINHPVKSRQFYCVVCESACNPHNSTAHLRPMYPYVQLNKHKSLQLGIPSQYQWPKPSFTKSIGQNLLPNKVISLFFPLTI